MLQQKADGWGNHSSTRPTAEEKEQNSNSGRAASELTMSGGYFYSVLVTGANRGIGLELVRQLLGQARPPRWVFATCRDPAKAQELKKLGSKHPGLVILRLESTDEASIEASAKEAETHLAGSGLNLLINNAGIMLPSTLELVTQEEMLNVYHVNVVGPMLVTKAFLPLLKTAAQRSSRRGLSCGRAAVINVSTIGSSIGNPPSMDTFPVISYRCSKTALNMLTRCQALEYKDDSILCAALHPGWVKTELGTDKAELTVEESVSGILEVLSSLSEEQNGRVVDWEGKPVLW
ncbi:C-signal-like [Elgaria multicarinata webbii]|uniref:C-signal-like n=1 Tax=Elgaria multicarinata webbii TaxID=159646 RepID=UPI002FCD3604